MRKSIKLLLIIVIAHFTLYEIGYTQDIKGGTINYEQFTQFDVSVFGNDPKVIQWLSDMPSERRQAKVLYFNRDLSLYENDISESKREIDPKEKVMVEKLAYSLPPIPEVLKIFVDITKNRKTEQVEFMTRFFIIDKDVELLQWKIGTMQRRILGYLCQEGFITRGKETITAWYTPDIPFSLGPDDYRGLPGLILAVDINGKNVLLATSLDLDSPEERLLTRPNEGKKIPPEALNKIVSEKTDEYNRIQKKNVAIKK
jgi:GLPGLI family protein